LDLFSFHLLLSANRPYFGSEGRTAITVIAVQNYRKQKPVSAITVAIIKIKKKFESIHSNKTVQEEPKSSTHHDAKNSRHFEKAASMLDLFDDHVLCHGWTYEHLRCMVTTTTIRPASHIHTT
jgi:hypothetical protein